MRIAANEIERRLALAAEEVAAERSYEQRGTRTEELMDALGRAETLRRLPFGHARVRGRKNGQYQEVITTGETDASGKYRRCLVPYTAAQELNRRRTSAKYMYRRRNPEGKPQDAWQYKPPQLAKDQHLDVRALLPYHSHDQMIREDRLERT